MSSRVTKLHFNGERESNKFRTSIGLAKIKSAWKKCLCCGKKFFSINVCNNRMCTSCAVKQE